MQPLNKKDTVNIGTIVGVHGIKGIVKIKVYGDLFWNHDDYHSCIKSKMIVLHKPSKNETKNIVIESAKHHKSDVFLFKIKDINDRDSAKSLVKYELTISKKYLPEIQQDEFYDFNLIGLDVICEDLIIGKIKNIENFGSEFLLEIELKINSKVEYFPFTKKDILSVDIENKNITVNKNSIWINNLLEK